MFDGEKMFVSESEAWRLASSLGRLAPAAEAVANRHSRSETVDWTLPGFLGRVRIQTAFGQLPIEALRVNDPVLTTTGRKLLVRRVKRLGLDPDFLKQHPDAHPILISTNAFGPGLPQQDLLVSPAQVLTVRMADMPPKPMKARDIGACAVVRAIQSTAIYYSFELSEPAYVLAEGIPVLVPGYQAAPQEDDDDEE